MPNKAERQALNEAIDTYRSYRDSYQDSLLASEEEFQFFLGNQWKSADKANLEAKNLPYLTKNLILPIINRIAGMEIANQSDMIVTPTEGGFDYVAEAMTTMNFFFKRRGKLNDLLSKMFVMGVISDMGAYIRPVYSTLDDPLGDIQYHLINGMNVLPDPMARKYDYSDAKRIVYTTWWTKEDAISHYPNKKKEISSLQSYKSGFLGTFKRKSGTFSDLVDTQSKITSGGRYRVIELWEKKEIRKTFLFDPFTEERFEPKSLRERSEILFFHPNVVERTARQVRMKLTVTIGDNVVLYSGDAPLQLGRYPFIHFAPYFLDGERLGVVHNLRDYQSEHNKRSSAILHILMSTANSGWMYRKGSVDPDKLERDGTGLGAHIEWVGEKPEKIQPNSIPMGLVQADNESKTGLYETSGIGPNLLGRAETGRETGKLFEKRVDEGNIMLQPIFANYALTKQLLAEYQIELYQKKFTPERIMSIITKEAQPDKKPLEIETAKKIVQDMRIGKYNVVVESVAKAASQRQNSQQQVANLIKFMPPEIVPWHDIIRLTDLPPDIKERMASYAEQRLGVANQTIDEAGQNQQKNIQQLLEQQQQQE